MRKLFVLLSLFVLPAALVAAAGAEETTTTETAKDEIVISFGVDDTLSLPWQGLNGWFPWVFDRLVERDGELRTERPNLAESWETSADGTSLTFYLRDDVTWHDGEKFTAEDVKVSVEYAVLPENRPHWAVGGGLRVISGMQDYLDGNADEISGIDVIDDYTIRFNLPKPDAYFFTIFGGFDILPAHKLLDIDPTQLIGSDFFQNPIGTGPYVWTEFEPQQFIVLEAREGYHRGDPKIERVILRDVEPQVAAPAGEIDLGWSATVGPAMEVDALPDYEAVAFETPRTQSFEVIHSNVSDPRIRKALLYAIDREAIVTSMYEGQAKLTRADIIPAGNYYENKDLPIAEYDPDKAKQLLEEAGWDPERELDILYYYPDDTTKSIMEAIQFYYSEVGVKAGIRYVTGETLWDALEKGSYDVRYVGSNFVDPTTLESYMSGAYDNRPKYSNERVNELLEMGRSVIEPAERKKYYDQVQEILFEDMAGIPLWTPNTFTLKRTNLKLPEGVMAKTVTSHDMLVHLWEFEN